MMKRITDQISHPVVTFVETQVVSVGDEMMTLRNIRLIIVEPRANEDILTLALLFLCYHFWPSKFHTLALLYAR